MKRLLNYKLHEMLRGPRFKISLWRGDEHWKASLHFDWKWRGKYYWLVIFLPEWLLE